MRLTVRTDPYTSRTITGRIQISIHIAMKKSTIKFLKTDIKFSLKKAQIVRSQNVFCAMCGNMKYVHN